MTTETLNTQPRIKVLHVLGGQVVIGEIVREDPFFIVSNPYEVFTTPNDSSLKTTIALIPYGTIYGVMPELAPVCLTLVPANVVAPAMQPPPALLEAYFAAVSRAAEERVQIQDAMIKSQTDITNGGTL